VTIFDNLTTGRIIKFGSWTIGITLCVYFIASMAFFLYQEKIIFQHDVLSLDHKFTVSSDYEEHFINTPDGERLNALVFKAPQPSKGLVLYFHGNADNLERWGNYAVDFTSLGYDVVMIDYRGYGKSTGTPSEALLYQDAHVVLKWVQTNMPHQKLVVYGRSLGTAVASHLAKESKPDLLILETPFDELAGTMSAAIKPLLYFFPLRHTFSNKEFLPSVTCRKVIFHGTNDWVVPLSSAEKLKPLLNENDEFVIIEGGGHRNLRDFPIYHEKLKEILVYGQTAQ
jgi:fermentation-respiration switch protein FrsA (DUF1100 family)